VYYDEVLEARLAQLSIPTQIALYAEATAAKQRPEQLVNSPGLYHSLLHPALRLLGTNPFSIRLLAWLTGGLLVPLAFVLLTWLFPTRLAVLATLGFNFAAWRVELAQMGRPHSLFLAVAMLSLILFRAAATRRSWAAWLAYCVVLAAAVQASYWGILVVVPAHFVGTVVLRKTLPNWRGAVAAQVIAGATSLYYVMGLLSGYEGHSAGDPSMSRALAVPLFARCLVLFVAGSLSKLELWDLPLVAGITLVVFVVVIRGAVTWWQSRRGLARWLGVCVGLWVVLLFIAHSAAASLASWPMERRFALLLVPLLISFTFGVQSIRAPGWRYAVMGAWIAVTGFFGLRSMRSDLFRDGAHAAAVVAAQGRPQLVYSNREIFMNFLVAQERTAAGVSFRRVRRNANGELSLAGVSPDTRTASLCICLIREGDYLRGRLRALARGEKPPDVDRQMKDSVDRITESLTALRWRPTASAYYPGRVSYQVACFEPAQRVQAGAP
jgi:4-amino-4-deoxy-L-arabinose transferase-like glycosyltransferase